MKILTRQALEKIRDLAEKDVAYAQDTKALLVALATAYAALSGIGIYAISSVPPEFTDQDMNIVMPQPQESGLILPPGVKE